MAKKKSSKSKTKKPSLIRRLRKWLMRGVLVCIALAVLVIGLFSFINPPTTPYIFSEARRLNMVERTWVNLEDIAPVMARSVVAAEDADFCLHWGLDPRAIQAALDSGGARGGSTISQQVVKNMFLWQGRSYVRKALEAVLTPATELIWTKRRIIELYLNIAEFDEGVFGVGEASWHYFGVPASQLTPVQAARLAAILPAPKNRSASNPSSFVRNRAANILDGAATINADGRADCFQQ